MNRDEVKTILKAETHTLVREILAGVKSEAQMRRDLVGYGRMISPEAEAYVTQALKNNESTGEIQRHLLDMANIVPGAKLNPHGRITSFKQISDDEFFRALAEPAPNPLDPGGPQRGRRSFADISDSDFFAGLTNPAEYNGGR